MNRGSTERLKLAYELALESDDTELIQRAWLDWKFAEGTLTKADVQKAIDEAEKRWKSDHLNIEALRTILLAREIFRNL